MINHGLDTRPTHPSDQTLATIMSSEEGRESIQSAATEATGATLERRDDLETMKHVESLDARTSDAASLVFGQAFGGGMIERVSSFRGSSMGFSQNNETGFVDGYDNVNIDIAAAADTESKEEEEEEASPNNPLDDTMADAEDRLDIMSVLSGNVDDDKDIAMSDHVFGKRLFEDSEMDAVAPPPASAVAAPNSKSSVNPSRPPLAPGRAASVNNNVSSNTSAAANASKPSSSSNSSEDKRLSVYLRVRPPVSATGIEGIEGAISTIEVLNGDKSSNKNNGTLPSIIRTYPPLSSNAAKVVRTRNRHGTASDSSLKKVLSSKSLNDDGSTDSGTDPNAEVRGVKEYAYSGVFGPNSTQSDIYNNVAAPLVEGLFPNNSGDGLGESALLFTLGVTNAGKTHTVMGTGFEKKKKQDGSGVLGNKAAATTDNDVPHKDWGIIPRSLHHMLARINSLNGDSNATFASSPKLQMYMSYLEIYNEQIYDLLPDKAKAAPRRPCDGPPALKLRESRRGRIFVRGLAKHPVSNVHQGLELAQEAKNNRHTASNNINANSSRSHSICQLEIAHFYGGGTVAQSDTDTVSEYDTDDDSSVCSKSSSGSRKSAKRNSTIIWIVDLAGSERSKRTGMAHTRHQKEAALINASLMNLMRCLREMLNHQPKKRGAATKGGVVPFRESKLTHMFMNHLTGPSASRTCMVVNVNPAADDFDETSHVLAYASTARNVKISAVDYNRKRRILAKESKVQLSPIKKLASKIAKKISPKKRKGGDGDTKPAAKRPRSNYDTTRAGNKKFDGATAAATKEKKHVSRPVTAPRNDKVDKAIMEELEQLREDNFSLKFSVEDLQKQLAECEADVRQEVVDMMTEQLQESKEWYEKRITNLRQQIVSLQMTNSKKAQLNAQEHQTDFLERINECEDEMKRMREEHEAELAEKDTALLCVQNEHVAETESAAQDYEEKMELAQAQKKELEAENGMLRHQTEELRVSHDTLLTKYNELLALHQSSQSKKESYDTFDTVEKGNPTSANVVKSPASFKRLPRERCSDVASTQATVDIALSPKKKRTKFGFLKSPPKVAAGSTNTTSRSPLGKVSYNKM